MAAAAGIDYAGPEFRKEFADYIKKYGSKDLYPSGFYDFPTEEERWRTCGSRTCGAHPAASTLYRNSRHRDSELKRDDGFLFIYN